MNNDVLYLSKDVVFYVNSVKMIKQIIKRNNLTPDQVNIICADTEKNKKDLKKIGHSVSKAPGRGKPHKMFTFCTRTTYVGADFYSTCAWSVIVSDCKIDALSTDIRMDFPQIMGRQRLKENVFRDECLFIYKLSDSEITIEEFENISRLKLKESEIDILNFRSLSALEDVGCRSSKLLEDLRYRIQVKRYSQDYTGINELTGEVVINKLVYLAEKRAFELRSNVYKNEVRVYDEFLNSSLPDIISLERSEKLTNHLETLSGILLSSGRFSEKMKYICDFLLDEEFYGYVSISDIRNLPRNYRNYLNILGPEKIKSLGYRESDIMNEIYNIQSKDVLFLEFSNIFKLGTRYTLKDIKEIISNIYVKLNLSKAPKATDLLEYFEVKQVLIYDPETKKQSKGYEIIGLKIKE